MTEYLSQMEKNVTKVSDRQSATVMPDFVALVTSSALPQQLFIYCNYLLQIASAAIT